jgi:hypothetical protein
VSDVNFNAAIPKGYTQQDMLAHNYQLPWGPAHTPAPGYGEGADELSIGGKTQGGKAKPLAPEKEWSPAQKLLVEGLKVGVSIAAGVVGCAFGGPFGAMVAGSLVSGSLTAIESNWQTGKIDVGKTLWDGAWGALPGFGGFGAKIAGRMFAQQGAIMTWRATVGRGLAQGFLDGGAMGFLRGGFEQARSDLQQGVFRPGQILGTALQSAGFAAVMGAGVGVTGNSIARRLTRTNPFIGRQLTRHRTTEQHDLPEHLQRPYAAFQSAANPQGTAIRGYDAFRAGRVLGDSRAQQTYVEGLP